MKKRTGSPSRSLSSYLDLSSILLIFFVSYFFTEYLVRQGAGSIQLQEFGGTLFVATYIIISLSLIIIYYIAVNVTKIMYDRVRGTVGSRFRLKVFVFFLIVTLIPTALLWFFLSPYFRLISTHFFTKNLYKAVTYGEHLAKDYLKHRYGMPVTSTVLLINNQSYKRVPSLIKKNPLQVSCILKRGNNGYYRYVSGEKKQYNWIMDNHSGLVAEQEFSRDHTPSIIKIRDDDGDSRYYFIAKYSHEYEGTYLIYNHVPSIEVAKVHMVRNARTTWLEAQTFVEGPFRSYGWVIFVMTIPIILFTVWLGHRFSKGITGVIKQLLEATRKVSQGDLDYTVKVNSHDELYALVNGFNSMVRELREHRQEIIYAQRVMAWREVARRLAHEINNPLTPIRLSAERLQKQYNEQADCFGETLKKSVKQILHSVDTVNKLIDDFRHYARLPQSQHTPIDLSAIVEVSLTDVETEADQIKLVTSFISGLWIMGDKKQITQVVLNLFKNAQHAVRERATPEIEIITRKNDKKNRAELIVRDNGCGISKKDIEHVYDPYYTTKKEGSGIGLAVVHRIVMDHGAMIHFRSLENEGTSVIIEFPLLEETDETSNIDH